MGIVSRQVLSYDADKDQFNNIVSGEVYVDNGRGNYAIADNPDLYLEPGWRAPVWFENYTKLFT